MKFCFPVAGAFLLAAVPFSADAAGCSAQREQVTIALPSFDSPAELVKPPVGVKNRAIVVLFPGSDVADKDGAIEGASGSIISRPMQQVADKLACAGFTTLRYNKRFVTGPTTVDRDKFDTLNGSDFVADGRTALAYIANRREFAKLPVALVGWSEGTTVALSVAAAERSVRALVLMAPVVESAAKVAQQQYGRVGKPYLARFATNGVLDADAIARADAGAGGVLAHIFVRMFRGFRPGERINPLLDTNGDRRISFAEADPVLASWYADVPNGGLGMSATGRALPGLSASYSKATPPVLILQGLNDAMIAPEPAIAFASRHSTGRRVMLKTYPALGHSLGAAVSIQEDGLLPVADKPLDDLVVWLSKTLR